MGVGFYFYLFFQNDGIIAGIERLIVQSERLLVQTQRLTAQSQRL